jgi:hypothetical protein
MRRVPISLKRHQALMKTTGTYVKRFISPPLLENKNGVVTRPFGGMPAIDPRGILEKESAEAFQRAIRRPRQ